MWYLSGGGPLGGDVEGLRPPWNGEWRRALRSRFAIDGDDKTRGDRVMIGLGFSDFDAPNIGSSLSGLVQGDLTPDRFQGKRLVMMGALGAGDDVSTCR